MYALVSLTNNEKDHFLTGHNTLGNLLGVVPCYGASLIVTFSDNFDGMFCRTREMSIEPFYDVAVRGLRS